MQHFSFSQCQLQRQHSIKINKIALKIFVLLFFLSDLSKAPLERTLNMISHSNQLDREENALLNFDRLLQTKRLAAAHLMICNCILFFIL